jgi:prophage regulatory protein
MQSYPSLPAVGYLRLTQIIGNPKANPPIPPVIPVSKSTWWAGVKSGRYPPPVKLGPRVTAWPVESVRALIEQVAQANKSELRTPARNRTTKTERTED